MGKHTDIEWCDHTFNPWWGCQKISPGCDNCYAAALDHRLGGDHWGPKAPYRSFGDKHWNGPRRWNDAAAKAGVRRRVFSASMADVADLHAPRGERQRLWKLIDECRALDWLLLSKRPQNFARLLPWMVDRGDPWPHVWLGVTAEDQQRADERIPLLLETPAAVRFLSVEPLLGPVDLTRIDHGAPAPFHIDALAGYNRNGSKTGIDWVIAGCESGPGARPMQDDWVRALRDQCAAAGVPFFLKQAMRGGKLVKLPELDGVRHKEFPT